MTLRSILRACYGVRLRMLHERQAIWGEAKDFNPEAFCWTGNGSLRATKTYKDGDRPEDHLANVIAAKIGREGFFDLEACMAEYERWTTPPTEPTAKE